MQIDSTSLKATLYGRSLLLNFATIFDALIISKKVLPTREVIEGEIGVFIKKSFIPNLSVKGHFDKIFCEANNSFHAENGFYKYIIKRGSGGGYTFSQQYCETKGVEFAENKSYKKLLQVERDEIILKTLGQIAEAVVEMKNTIVNRASARHNSQ